MNEAALVGWVARYDFRRAADVSARTLFYRELDFRRRVLGTEHPDTLTSFHLDQSAVDRDHQWNRP
jgi:hypothetical protein